MWSVDSNKIPLHPLGSIIYSIVTLTWGLLIRDVRLLYIFIFSLVILFSFAGYFKAVIKVYRIVIPLGAVVGLLAFLLGDGLMGSLITLGRISLLGFSSVLVVTIDATGLARSLTQVGSPRWLSLGFLITVRFIPVLKEEIQRIREAMMVRGVNPKKAGLQITYRAFVLPLIIRLIKISDTLAVSLETRGFSTEVKGTIYRPLHWSVKDCFVSFGFIICIISVVFIQWIGIF